MTLYNLLSSLGSHERAFGLCPLVNRRAPHIPDFLWSFVGSLNFMRLSLKRAAARSCPELRTGNAGHLARFREMWDTRPPRRAAGGPRDPHGCPRFATAYPVENEGEAHHGLSFQTRHFVISSTAGCAQRVLIVIHKAFLLGGMKRFMKYSSDPITY
jgi:hypothetical protein